MNTVTRRRTTIRLPNYLLADLSSEARRQGISVNRLIENIAEERMYSRPNAETRAAIAECQSGVELKEVNLDTFEAFINSMEK